MMRVRAESKQRNSNRERGWELRQGRELGAVRSQRGTSRISSLNSIAVFLFSNTCPPPLLVSPCFEWLAKAVLLISEYLLSHGTLVLLRVLWPEYKKSLALLRAPDPGWLLSPQPKMGLYRPLSRQSRLTSEFRCIVSQISDLCDGNIYCPYNGVLRTMWSMSMLLQKKKTNT